MATAVKPCIAQLSRSPITLALRSRIPTPLTLSTHQIRTYAAAAVKVKTFSSSNPQKNKKKGESGKKKKKGRTVFKQYDMKLADQYSLCDAMRYLRAFEVGRPPSAMKYELSLKLKTLKNGPIIRNRLRLPHPVKTDLRVCVICPPDSEYAKSARENGATLVGEEEIFDAILDGKIEFDRCLCQTDSLQKMTRAGLGRILGPRGLMPSAKTGTVVKDPGSIVKELVGAAEYRERTGAIRMAVGQLAFGPEEMRNNIKVFIEAVKKDMGQLSDRVNKELAEVVLSSTNGPGFSLNGDFISPEATDMPAQLSGPM